MEKSLLSPPAAGKTVREDHAPDAAKTARLSHRWAIVLAGGDGVRLRGLTRLICGDDRPKQFCPLLGDCTLLEQARQRAERSILSEQIVFAVTKAHEDYYLRDLGHRFCHRIVQPCNKGTAPPILYSLLHIAEIDQDATVAVLPCDHYYSDESTFTRALNSAFEIAATRPQSVVLLGAEANAPEVEYGWIEVGCAVQEELFQVRAFHEKPPRPVAERLLGVGALWNTFVMVGHIDAFLQMAAAIEPALLELFRPAIRPSYKARETRIPESLYDWFSPLDFSRHVLSPAAKRLVALPLRNMEWHDLGDPERVLSTLLTKRADLPKWAKRWQATRKPAASTAGLSHAVA
jgi:mannose-1-phosphate guanylyltransferase